MSSPSIREITSCASASVKSGRAGTSSAKPPPRSTCSTYAAVTARIGTSPKCSRGETSSYAVTPMTGIPSTRSDFRDPSSSGKLVQPAVGVLGAAVLDVQQRLTDLDGHGSRLRCQLDRSALPLERADRRDDRGRATGEGLDDVATAGTVTPIVDRDLALVGAQTEIGREFQHRTRLRPG